MPPPQHPPAYPLDVTPRFTTHDQGEIGKGIQAIEPSLGILHDPVGDLKTWVAVGFGIKGLKDLYTALAYLDIVDGKADALADGQNGLHQKVDALSGKLDGLAGTLDGLAGKVDGLSTDLARLTDFLGAVIPQWRTKEEIENGDEMGIAVRSAADLNLVVEFIILQREPGFGHEDVVSIDPPAGTLVAKGSTVKVTLNLEG